LDVEWPTLLQTKVPRSGKLPERTRANRASTELRDLPIRDNIYGVPPLADMLRRKQSHPRLTAEDVSPSATKRSRAEQSPASEDGIEVEVVRSVRARRAQTSGEIRLSNEVAAFRAAQDRYVQGVTFDYADHEGGAFLVITYLSDSGSVCPNRFQLQVRKFYPHDRPELTCLDSGFACNHISPAGEVIHGDLRDPAWSATGGLQEIVACLQDIRLMWIEDPGRMTGGSGGLGGADCMERAEEDGEIDDRLLLMLRDERDAGGVLTRFDSSSSSGSAFLPFRHTAAGQETKSGWQVDQQRHHTRLAYLTNIGEMDPLEVTMTAFACDSLQLELQPVSGSSASLLAGDRLSSNSKTACDTTFTSLFSETGADGMHAREGAHSTSTAGAICDEDRHGIYGEYDDRGTDEERDNDSEDADMDMDAASQESL